MKNITGQRIPWLGVAFAAVATLAASLFVSIAPAVAATIDTGAPTSWSTATVARPWTCTTCPPRTGGGSPSGPATARPSSNGSSSTPVAGTTG